MDDWTAKMLGTAFVVALAYWLKGRKHPMQDWLNENQPKNRQPRPPSEPSP